MKKQILILSLLLLIGTVSANSADLIYPDDETVESPVEFQYEVEVDQDSTIYLVRSDGYGNSISYDPSLEHWINIDTGAEVNFDSFVEEENQQSASDGLVTYTSSVELDAGEHSWNVFIDTNPSTSPDGEEVLGSPSWKTFDVEAKPPVINQLRVLPSDTISPGTDFEVDFSAYDPNGQDTDIILTAFESGSSVDTVERSYGDQISDGISANEFDYSFGEGEYEFELEVYNQDNKVTSQTTSLSITDDDSGGDDELNELAVSLSGDQNLEEGETGNFNADLFSNGEGTVEYQFFIDGSPQTTPSTSSSFSHTFSSPGTYQVEVVAQDSENQEDSDVISVSVDEEQEPFEVSLDIPEQITAGEMFLMELESESTIVQGDWEIDGSQIDPIVTSGTSANVELPEGNYVVEATAEGPDGQTDSVNEVIEVEGDGTVDQNLIWVGLGLMVILLAATVAFFTD